MAGKDREVAMEVGSETKKTPTKKSPKKKLPTRITPAKRNVGKRTRATNSRAKNTPKKKTPTKKTPAIKTPTEDATAKEPKPVTERTLTKLKKNNRRLEALKPMIKAADIPEKMKVAINKSLEHKNLPRNKSKFKRFMQNCCSKSEDDLIDRVWEKIVEATPKPQANGEGKKKKKKKAAAAVVVKATENGDTTSPKRKLKDGDAEEGNKKMKVEQTGEPEEEKQTGEPKGEKKGKLQKRQEKKTQKKQKRQKQKQKKGQKKA